MSSFYFFLKPTTIGLSPINSIHECQATHLNITTYQWLWPQRITAPWLFFPPSSHQLPLAPCPGVASWALPTPMLEYWMAWWCAGNRSCFKLRSVAATAFYMILMSVAATIFYMILTHSPALGFFLPLLPWWSLSLGGWEQEVDTDDPFKAEHAQILVLNAWTIMSLCIDHCPRQKQEFLWPREQRRSINNI